MDGWAEEPWLIALAGLVADVCALDPRVEAHVGGEVRVALVGEGAAEARRLARRLRERTEAALVKVGGHGAAAAWPLPGARVVANTANRLQERPATLGDLGGGPGAAASAWRILAAAAMLRDRISMRQAEIRAQGEPPARDPVHVMCATPAASPSEEEAAGITRVRAVLGEVATIQQNVERAMRMGVVVRVAGDPPPGTLAVA